MARSNGRALLHAEHVIATKRQGRDCFPGQPDRSVLLTRLNRRGANSGQMPQVGTNVVDERAVKLFRDWISQLTADAVEK